MQDSVNYTFKNINTFKQSNYIYTFKTHKTHGGRVSGNAASAQVPGAGQASAEGEPTGPPTPVHRNLLHQALQNPALVHFQGSKTCFETRESPLKTYETKRPMLLGRS